MPDVWVVSESPELRQDPSEESQMMVLEKQNSIATQSWCVSPYHRKKKKRIINCEMQRLCLLCLAKDVALTLGNGIF